MTEKTLSGKNALVTGAAKRIGRAIAHRLASEGANIILHYRSSGDEASSLRSELEAYGVKCWPLRADFEKRDEYEKLIDTAFEAAGGLDILVNSASIFPESTINGVTWEDLEGSMQVNMWVPLYLSRRFAHRAKAGSIVNLLDTRVRGFDLKHVAYILSKQALESVTRIMALEFAPGIRVNGVAPGLILPPPGKDERYLEQLVGTVPLRRHGGAEDIAGAVLFLAASEFITGQVIYVDGGRHLREQSHG